jgi:hypothetical protein
MSLILRSSQAHFTMEEERREKRDFYVLRRD